MAPPYTFFSGPWPVQGSSLRRALGCVQVVGGAHSPTGCQQGQDPGLATYCCSVHPLTRVGAHSPVPGSGAGGRCIPYF